MIKALVLYHSQQYGNTAKMAEAVAKGLRNSGCEVTSYNVNEGRYPIEQYGGYDCVAFGSPDYFSYVAGMMKQFMDDWYINRAKPGFKDKPYALFYTHGGGGRSKEAMVGLFKYLGRQIGEPVGAQGEPSTTDLEKCIKLGEELEKATKR